MQINNTKTRSGIAHEITGYQTDLQGNVTGFIGTVNLQNQQGETVKEPAIWDLAGRYISDHPALLDLVHEYEKPEPKAEEGKEEPEQKIKTPKNKKR